jgi:16S rRNA G527 N7-methylase RsmG
VEAWERHILDSLALLPTLDAHAAATHDATSSVDSTSSSSSKLFSVIDVGTGAGLPGMVLAVVRPQWKVRGDSRRGGAEEGGGPCRL